MTPATSPEASEAEAQTDGETSPDPSDSIVRKAGYTTAVLVGILGSLYFLSTLETVLFGGSGQNALQSLYSSVIAAACFGFAIFVMLSIYILYDT